MLKSLLRSTPNRVLDILSDTMIGRALLRQAVAIARRKLGFELDIQPQPGERDLWLVTAGDPGADLTLRCTVRTQTLAKLATPILTAWLENKPIPSEEILPLLLQAMRKEEGVRGNINPSD